MDEPLQRVHRGEASSTREPPPRRNVPTGAPSVKELFPTVGPLRRDCSHRGSLPVRMFPQGGHLQGECSYREVPSGETCSHAGAHFWEELPLGPLREKCPTGVPSGEEMSHS